MRSIQTSDAESREKVFLPLVSKSVPETPFKRNNILFTVFYPQYTCPNNINFRYKLDGLDENLSSEDDWAIFQTNFDRIHEKFFRNLLINFPDLTPNDLRFCAYLRLNLSSKDIAHLMNITLKGVEVGRYRVRKKIGIPSTKSLTEFMIEFK